jgi:UDP-perosamine 4-acetyltransferase
MKLFLVGARIDGQAHLVLDLLAETAEHRVVAFLDETPALAGTTVHGIPVVGAPSDLQRAVDMGAEGGMVSIGSGVARQRIADIIRSAGLALPTLIHPRAAVAPSATIGEGCFVGALAVVNSGAIVEDLALLSPTAFVGHHAVVGTAASMAPGARMGGRSSVGRRSFIGLGANVLPDRRVGDDVVIGAGSVVVRDVASGTSAIGVPASVMRRRERA